MVILQVGVKEIIMISAQKMSISIPLEQYNFLTQYQIENHYKSRSEVIQKALKMLYQIQLESDYREASREVDESFDITNMDGLSDDETW